jgi:sucrose-6-phosphate hydrolase SacC (GH32 family)
MDPGTQTLIKLVPPLVSTGNTGSLPTQLMDASTYASKSFYDPVNKQQVWTSWVHDAGSYCSHNASVCSTHTLPRTLLWDAEIQAHVTPPVPQTQLLRKTKLHSLAQPMPLGADAFVALPAAVEASGMQLEIEATFSLPFPPGLRAGLSVRRSPDGMQSTQSCIDMGSSPAPMTPCVTSPDDDALQQPYRTTADGVDHERSRGQAAAQVPGNMTVASVSVLVSNTNDLDEWSRTHKNGTEFHGGRLKFPMKPSDRNVTLRMFVDHSVIESYAQGGRAVVTQRGYPTDDALGVAVGTASRGGSVGITVLALDVWEIDTIWVNKV